MTREVKKPRESLTTIGVLRICRTRSKARPSASSPVSGPRMISTSGILSTGEKKCRPMKSAGRSTPSASRPMGRVEVLEQSSASGATTCWISWNTLCLSSGFSKTASMTVSQPARSAGSAVGVIRARKASRSSAVFRPRATCLSSRPALYAFPRSAASGVTSLSSTVRPACAHAYAMPAPIMPAPSTATFEAFHAGTELGREAPELTACMSKKKAWIMFLEVAPQASSVKYRASMANAVSTSTWVLSTAAARMLRGAG